MRPWQSLLISQYSSDKLESFLTIPMGKTTEIHPVHGKSISLRIKATKNFAVTLYEKPQADSARYRFIIFDQNGNSQIRRAAEGDSNDNQQKWTSTPNALGPDPKWRTIWIDFRSSNLVLGSGGEVLLQWNDPSPISVSYVSFTTDATMSTTIYYYNRQTESELRTFSNGLSLSYYLNEQFHRATVRPRL